MEMFGVDDKVLAAINGSSHDGIPFRARSGHQHSTWARTFSSLPELYIQPESQSEVEKVIRLARLCRRRITTVGCGHSPSSITCTRSWLINLDNFKRVLSVQGTHQTFLSSRIRHSDKTTESTGIMVVQSGIRLWQLTEAMRKHHLSFPVLGSINEQSIAGVISTGTRGSTLQHGLISEAIQALKITLANGTTVSCSADDKPDLFRGALLSLGALGIIIEVTLKAVPAFSLKWTQTIQSESSMISSWLDDNRLWTECDFARVWWLPYLRRAVVWKADTVTREDLELGREAHFDPPEGYYDGPLGFHIYQNLLWLSRPFPSITPWIEW